MGMVIFTQVHNIHFDSEKRFTILSPLFPILCYLDLMELPVTNLDEPESSRLLRKIDDLFVESLKQRLKQDPTGPGVPPLAVVCKTVTKKEAFQDRLKDVYRYEVQGGLHGAKARQALFSENPDMTTYARAYCTVYCGLSDEEALRLASRHNVNGHFIHKMTHRDYVSIN